MPFQVPRERETLCTSVEVELMEIGKYSKQDSSNTKLCTSVEVEVMEILDLTSQGDREPKVVYFC